MNHAEALAASYPLGWQVAIQGHAGHDFVVDGYWREYVRVEHVATGTTHCVSPSDILRVWAPGETWINHVSSMRQDGTLYHHAPRAR